MNEAHGSAGRGFDRFPELYDSIIDWELRLGREIPFLDRLFREGGVRRVLDLACGTGRHAVALSKEGYEVEGVDVSPRMIELAQAHARSEGLAVNFHVADMARLSEIAIEPADAIICLGNAIPQQTTRVELRKVLAVFRKALRAGGTVVLHQRNWNRVWERRERWMPARSMTWEGREWIFLRFYEFEPRRRLQFHVVWLERQADGWKLHPHEVAMRAWYREDFDRAATGLFEPGRVHGSFDGEAHRALESPDLIWVSRARG